MLYLLMEVHGIMRNMIIDGKTMNPALALTMLGHNGREIQKESSFFHRREYISGVPLVHVWCVLSPGRPVEFGLAGPGGCQHVDIH